MKISDKVLIIGTILLLIIIIGFTAYLWLQLNHPWITVINHSGDDIKNITIGCTSCDNFIHFNELSNGKSETIRLSNFIGEAAINLTYFSKREKIEWYGGYIEQSKGYRVILTINSNQTIEYKSGYYFIRKD